MVDACQNRLFSRAVEVMEVEDLSNADVLCRSSVITWPLPQRGMRLVRHTFYARTQASHMNGTVRKTSDHS